MKTEEIDGKTLETWTPQEVADAFARREIVLVDVRTPQEFAMERIRGALLAPMQDFDADHLPAQERRRIVLHCGSGMRSERVAKLILDAGQDRIAHMEGGMAGWKEAGLSWIGTDVATGAPKEMKKG